MTTPNIEELITDLRSFFIDENVSAIKANQIANALQSQAERIKELEKQHIERLLRIEKEVDVLVAERDELRENYSDTYWALDDAAWENTNLRAQLEDIAAAEPVAEVGGTFTLYWVGSGPIEPIVKKYGIKVGDKLFTRPMPAQDVTELVEAFEYHIEQTRPIERSTIALSKYKGAKA